MANPRAQPSQRRRESARVNVVIPFDSSAFSMNSWPHHLIIGWSISEGYVGCFVCVGSRALMRGGCVHTYVVPGMEEQEPNMSGKASFATEH